MGKRSWTLLAFAILVVFTLWWRPENPIRNLPIPVSVIPPSAPGVLVVDLLDNTSAAEMNQVSQRLGSTLSWVHPLAADEALATAYVPDLAAAVARIKDHPLVEVVEPEMDQTMMGYPNDPLYEKQWNLRSMGAPVGWARTSGGSGVTVAVLDTGVAPVADLTPGTVLPGVSFVQGEETHEDFQGHGTHVAGTIAQATNNGIGTAGVAPAASILPVKVLSSKGQGKSAWIAAGVDYAADEGAQVINLSLGGAYSKVIHLAVKKARNRGVLVVAAAGNSGRKGVSYPGGLKETIGVSAVGPNGSLAPYSSWGAGVDIAAPGGDKQLKEGGILQNTIGGDSSDGVYLEFQGTSMATPHVAGAAAILLSNGLSVDQVEPLLLTSANGSTFTPKLGHGRLDLAQALSHTGTGYNLHRFLWASFATWLLIRLGMTRKTRMATAVLVAGFTAGGLFFLGWMPVGDGYFVSMLSRGILDWPVVFLGRPWVSFPLWLSALLPFCVTFALGAVSISRPVAIGFVSGIGTHLLHGAVTGSLEPSFIPFGLGGLWLGVNAAVCLLFALAMIGMEQVDEE